MNQDDIYNEIKKLANQHNVEINDNAVNIARFRARTGLPLSKCPCAPGDTERGCISEKCMREIEKYGYCHCHCFRRSDG